MKKIIAIALALVLTMCLFAGCRNRQNDTNGNNSTPSETGSNMLPDSADKVDPTNGANQEKPDDEPHQNTEASDPMPTDSTTGTENNPNSRNGNSGSRIFPQH